MKLENNKKYLQQNISRLVLVPQTTADFTSRITEREDRGSIPGLAIWIFRDWLGDDHLILRGGGAWHFLEINILTLKMLEINNLFSFGKKINNLTLTC